MSQSPPFDGTGHRAHGRQDSNPFQEPLHHDHQRSSITSERLVYRQSLESTTRRHAAKPQPVDVDMQSLTQDDHDYSHDPYAVPPRQYSSEKQPTSPRKQAHQDNAFMSYPNEPHDPYAPPGSMYNDDDVPSFNGNYSQPMSMTHDDMAMKNMNFNDFQHEASMPKDGPHLEPLPALKPRSRRRFFYLQRRYGVFVAFILVILTGIAVFFAWPRWPTMYYHSVSVMDGTSVVCTNVSMNANWVVTMRVDNSDNFVPTLISDLNTELMDANTGVVFAKGRTGKVTLPPRQSRTLIKIPMVIEYTSVRLEDPTWQSFQPCCGAEAATTAQPDQNLNVVFSVKQSVSGIVWKTTTTVRPSFFGCPVVPKEE